MDKFTVLEGDFDLISYSKLNRPKNDIKNLSNTINKLSEKDKYIEHGTR